MPRAAELLLRAVERYGVAHAEDRLTEIFATVLRLDRRLASWYCRNAGIDLHAADTYDVVTQVWLGPAGRVDMRLVVSGAADRRIRRVWSEHKVEADLRYSQLDSYAKATGDFGLAIVPDRREVPRDPRWAKVTWTEVAMAARKIGRAASGARWRRTAVDPKATAGQRVLHEFVDYLERENLDVPNLDPVQHLDVIAYGRGQSAAEKVKTLFFAASDRLSRVESLAEESRVEPQARSGGRGWFVQYQQPGEWWRDLPGVDSAWGEFLIAPRDEWMMDTSFDEPAFGAGISFGRPPYGQIGWPAALAQEDWLKALTHEEIAIGETDGGHVGRLFKTLYLSELMSKGADLDGQIEFLAGWAQRSIDRVAATRPVTS